MDEIEIIMFKEISDYSEKFYGLTFRQWIFSVLIAITVIPTYIFLPRYTPITQDICSYIVILEAGIIGFFGFVKINELSAEHIVPYWYRHFIHFGKPIKYMSDAEWAAAHEKKNKKLKQSAETSKEASATGNLRTTDTSDDKKPQLSKKQLKQQQKREKMLAKARKKYGYLVDDDVPAQADTVDNKQAVEKPVTEPVEKKRMKHLK